MTINQDIIRTKKKLITKWKRYGPYENFGQKEVRDLQHKYDYLGLCYGTPEQTEQARLIDAFNDWCMNYTGR